MLRYAFPCPSAQHLPSYFSQAAPQSAWKPHFLLLNGVSQQGAVSSLCGVDPWSRVRMIRADRKSQVRQCLGLCTADFWSSFAYESAEEKPKHCLTWDFLSALRMIRWGRLRAFWSFFTWAILSYTQYVVSWLLAHLWSVIFIQRLLPSQKYDFLS